MNPIMVGTLALTCFLFQERVFTRTAWGIFTGKFIAGILKNISGCDSIYSVADKTGRFYARKFTTRSEGASKLNSTTPDFIERNTFFKFTMSYTRVPPNGNKCKFDQ
jgi:hypothetical protein